MANVSDCVLVVDSSGHCMAANRAALGLIGAKSLTDLQCWFDRERRGHPGSEVFFRPSRDNIRARNLPFDFTNLYGEHKHTLVSFTPVDREHTTSPCVLYVLHDITDTKRQQTMRADLLQTVAHEMRNPFQVMKALVTTIRTKSDEQPDLRERIRLLDKQMDHVTRLFEGLLAAYDVGDAQISLSLAPANFVELVLSELQSFGPDNRRNLRLDVTEKQIPVNADSKRLCSAVHNLIENALSHTAEGGEIRIALGISDDLGCLDVEDNGCGIPEEDLERVFNGFYRPQDFKDWKSGGIGLGLYIGRSVARRHGGDLTAVGRPEGGMLMRLCLPLHQQLRLPIPAS